MNDISSSEPTGPVEARFGVALAVVGAAAALVAGISRYLPIESFAPLPTDIVEDLRIFTPLVFLFIACLIAAASYASYRKDRRRTIYIACVLFFLGLLGLGGLRATSVAWVAHDEYCEIPEFSRIVMSPVEPTILRQVASDIVGNEDYKTLAESLICNGRFGEQVRNALDEGSGQRRAALFFIAISSLIGLFSGLTLLTWSLAALQPVKRPAAKPAKKTAKKILPIGHRRGP